MVTNPPADTLYSAEDIENYLGISRATVYTLARKGILPKIRVSPRLIRFRASDVEAFLRGLQDRGKDTAI
jgi:excisionase family DNA binding protein